MAQALTTNQNSQLETNVLGFLGKLPFFPPFVSADQTRCSAWNAVVVIKPPASLLLPLATNAYNINQQAIAIGLLAGIGDGAEAAVPFLRERLRSDDRFQRFDAAFVLERLGPAAKAALPDLIELVKDVRARNLQHMLYRTLGNIGADATNAVPTLKERMANNTNIWTRIYIATALCRIEAHQSDALGWLTGQIKATRDRDERSRMITTLGEIGPNAKAAVPFLQELLNDPNRLTWHPAAESLLKIGETNLALSGTLTKLNGEGFHNRFQAAKFVLAAQPTNAAAMATLIELMKDSFSGYEAIKAVGNLGVAGMPAIPALREVVNGEYPSHYRQAARLALKDIKAASEEALADR